MNVFISFPYNYVNEADFDASAIKALEKDLQLLLFRIKYEPEAVAFF